MPPIINSDSLNRTSEKYNPVLQVLPFEMLEAILSELNINLLEVAGKDTIVTFNRLGGLSKPYVSGTIEYGELGKATERSLEVQTAYAALKDHIMNYKGTLIASNTPESEKVDNKIKKHPLEYLVLREKIKTISEDIINALFFAERDVLDRSPMGMFDGFSTLITKEVTAGEISAGLGNLSATGAIVAPVNSTDTDAYDKLVDFIRSAHPFLRKNCVLYLSNATLFAAQDALGNKIPGKDVMEYDIFLNHLKGKTFTPNLSLRTHYCLGSGDQLILTIPQNLDLGLNTKGDEKFVQVRSPFEDPNFIQFWSQWDAGTRIRSIHPKTFMINDGVAVSTELSGDYIVTVPAP
ncbi:MAG: hypothetical protein K0B15_06540 [Lentimicrobium sp.]|nr:hypothetical protein [Lentimicrobium sp.]